MGPKSPSVIHRLFYLLLHSVVTVLDFFEFSSKIILESLLGFPDPRPFEKISKIPNHVTVLLGAEPPSYQDLANVILWCMGAGVPFVSFYDYQGILKKNEKKLQRIVEKKQNVGDHVVWHSHPDGVHKNGYIGRKIHVKVLSHDDGRGGVVQLIKQLVQGGATHVNLDTFNQGLKKQFEFPDPDLGVCCGKTFSLFGYPPWQIRVTEFLTMGSHHNVTRDDFVMLLCRFDKCEQRFGK